jgi:hypothetical protein
MYDIIGGYYPVEIMGDEFVGDDYAGDEFIGDDYAGDDFVGQRGYPLARGGGMPRGRGGAPPWGAKRPQMRPGYGGQRPGYGRQMSPGMMQALAEKRAMAGALLDTRGATKSREYPLGFTSAAAVAAGASSRIIQRPQVPFRIDRLVIPSDLAGLFVIDDVKVGKNSQFAAEGAVPARIFQENAVGVTLKGDTAQVSMDVVISVTNISGAASFFRAAVIGPAVE